MKLCIIYNFAQHYRTSIFSLIDKEFESDFLFGDSMGDVQKMDYSSLRGDVIETHTIKLFRGWYWQPEVVTKLMKSYTHYILLGETRALSTWLFCIFARFFFPNKIVYFWSHGWYGKETKVERLLKKVLFNLPNGGVFLYGNYARELMIEEGFNPDKLFVIHNSLDYDQQLALRKGMSQERLYQEHFGNDNPNLFFVGRLTKVKQLDMALKALKKCKDSGYDYNFTFIGDGEVKGELMALTEELGLDDRVWFYGACYDEGELGRMIYNADLCVSPGNVGLTAMHSMVFGTPVITHNDFPHQMPEFEAIHEGVTGIFFEYGKVESLIDCIIKWVKAHQDQREEVRQSCYHEIDTQWTPQFQLEVLKAHLL